MQKPVLLCRLSIHVLGIEHANKSLAFFIYVIIHLHTSKVTIQQKKITLLHYADNLPTRNVQWSTAVAHFLWSVFTLLAIATESIFIYANIFLHYCAYRYLHELLHSWFKRMVIACAHGVRDCPGYPGHSAQSNAMLEDSMTSVQTLYCDVKITAMACYK